jgi:hypothetical protein
MHRWMPLLSLLVYLASFVSPAVAQDAPVVEAEVTGATCTAGSNNSYVNVDGNTIRSPVCATDGQVPAGASARCGDGTYSFSENRRGTCSGHNGVSQWLR